MLCEKKKCASCNATIDEVQALDHDSIPDTIDAIQCELKKQVMPSYPLISRALIFRKFRQRLSEWIEKLFICTDEADIVYDETMMETLIAWISAMSSSAYRSLRHTSTFVALLIVAQVNRMARDNQKEIKAAMNSREAEKTKGATANKVRVKDLDAKVRKANQIKKQLEVYQQELLDSVFIHRYRDSDASIRADCIGELGRWMKHYPDQYLVTGYFRYFGWMLSDPDAKVRHVAIKSLNTLYTRHEYAGPIQQFTERFVSRMAEMAVGDVDTSVRIAAIAILTLINQHNVLDEETKTSLSLHIFDVEPKIRSSIATFIKQDLDEEMREVEEDEDEEAAGESVKLRWKTLAQLLGTLSGKLDKGEEVGGNAFDTITTTIGEGTSSRVALAVGAVLEADEKLLQDWKPLIELLLYDHSNQDIGKSKNRKKAAGSNKDGEAPPNEAYRLEVEEETILLESVGVIIEKFQSQSQDGVKDSETAKDNYSGMTRDLIPILSKLFKKYKTESNRIAELLLLVRHMDMEVYVQFQQVGAFESLWDDIIDQYVRHSEEIVLCNAVAVMVALDRINAMSNINTTKMGYLRETVMQGLLESAQGIALESDELKEEQSHLLLSSVVRIKHLIRSIDLSQDMDTREDAEPDQEDNVLAPRDVLLSCAKRGTNGTAGEEGLVGTSLIILALYTMWSTRALIAMPEGGERKTNAATLCERRDSLVKIMNTLLEETIGQVLQQVKRQAFCQLVDLHVLFASVQASESLQEGGNIADESTRLPSLSLKCDMATQERLASFVKSELVRFARESSGAREDDESATEEEEGHAIPKTKSSTKNADTVSSRPTLQVLQRQMDFVSGLSHYIGAIRLGIVHVQFSVAMLSRFGRLGHLYDACLRVLVETIREVGINEGKPGRACKVIMDSLWEAHSLYCLDETTSDESTLINLAKMLSSSLVVRGAQLAVLKKVDGQAVVEMHRRGTRLAFEKLQRQSSQESQQQILVFFKAISQLLISIEPREAISIKKDMDRMIEEFNIEIPLVSKAWDGLRQYEKRLVTIASKSDSVRKHIEAKEAAAKSSARINFTLSEQERNEEGDGGDDNDDLQIDSMLELEDDGGAGDMTREEQQLDITM